MSDAAALSPPSSDFHGDPPRAATAQAVVDRRELAFIAMERTHMPMVMIDTRQADMPIVLANQAFLDLTLYRADEVIGANCRFLQGPETCDATIAELRAAIREGRDATVELLNYRKDGSSFWNELHISPIRDDEGELIYYFGSQRDVSARRSAQALALSEHRLMREVDHRAMNVLALVEGIVRRSDPTTPARYAAAIHRRVQALAKAHTLLSQHGWGTVPLDQLILDQVAAFGASQVTLAGPEVAVAATQVQALALVLHELAANAAIHGALSVAGGRLGVEWRLAGPDVLEMSWRETGGPAPAAEPKPGFGLAMVKLTLVRQLGGTLRLAWPPSGLEVDLSLPLGPAADFP
jgi:PAS domain S-box-containing protein